MGNKPVSCGFLWPTCYACGKALKPLMRIGTDKDDWLFEKCDTCGDDVCDKHSETNPETGLVQCEACYESSLWKKEEKR